MHSVHADESKVDMTKCITLTVKPGEKIKLDFAVATAGVWVKVTGVKDEKAEEAPTKLHDWKQQPEYEAKGTEIKVYGAIERFTCYSNGENLTALDVSESTNLTYLDCSGNRLSSLNISKNVNLTELDCKYNRLTALDVSQNVNLMELDCRYNRIEALDVRTNVKLEVLYCDTNRLSSLDVSQNVNLTILDCRSNKLTSLDVSPNVKLTSLNCYDNKIANLDVSANVALSDLSCSDNLLSSLDVSKNINLTNLYCSNNQLSDLDISKNTKLVELNLYGNNFSTSMLNNIYCQLPDQTGKKKGLIYLAAQVGKVIDELLVRSTSKTITDSKNWAIQYYFGHTNIEDITGNHTCGLVYGLTLAPATIPTFSYQGGEKKITVTSTGNWKLDETTPLPDWLSVEPKQGGSGTQVTVTAVPNAESGIHRAALTFVLSDAANTKQVVVLTQAGRPDVFITVAPYQDYTFSIEGEKKENYFTVESSGAWEVTSSNAEWFPVETKTGAAGTTKITIKAEANSKEERKTKLTFALKDKPEIKQEVTLKQKGFFISVTPAEGYTFPASGETKENYFTVESSLAWKVTSSNADWFPVETREGNAGTTKVTIKADANSSKDERMTELTFALKDNAEVKQLVTLRQSGKPAAVESVLLAGISVAPNPFSSLLKIKNSEAINARYELVNNNGVVVRSGILQGAETQLNTEALKTGVYLLRILSDNATRTLHVVKE